MGSSETPTSNCPRLMAALKRAVADVVGNARNLHAMCNVLGQMFASVELIDCEVNPFGSGKGMRDGMHLPVPGSDPQVPLGRAA